MLPAGNKATGAHLQIAAVMAHGVVLFVDPRLAVLKAPELAVRAELPQAMLQGPLNKLADGVFALRVTYIVRVVLERTDL